MSSWRGSLVFGIHTVVESAPPKGLRRCHQSSRSGRPRLSSSSSCDESTRVYPRGGSACTPMYRRASHNGGYGSHSLLLLVLGDISILLYTVQIDTTKRLHLILLNLRRIQIGVWGRISDQLNDPHRDLLPPLSLPISRFWLLKTVYHQILPLPRSSLSLWNGSPGPDNVVNIQLGIRSGRGKCTIWNVSKSGSALHALTSSNVAERTLSTRPR
jgi:hypothetical protein